MEAFSVKEVLLIAFGGAGIVAGLVSVLTFVAGRIDKARENKKQDTDSHITESSQFERIRLDSMIFTKETFIDLIRELQKQIADLREEVEKCESHRKFDRQEMKDLKIKINKLEKNVDGD